MGDRQGLVIGSETQYYETFASVTGIQRVVREAHLGLTDHLGVHGVRVVPVHTRDMAPRTEFRANPYLASDPVLDQPPAEPEDLDGFLLLDLNVQTDFSRLFRAKKQRPRPLIVMVHDIIPMLHPQWVPPQTDRSFRVYLQQMLALADHIVVTTQKVRADLLRLGWRIPGEIHVIGLGTTFEQREPPPADDARISMMYVSTVEPRKGHDALVGAFDLLRRQGHDVDLSLIGREGWECGDVVRTIRTHPDLGGRLRWFESADDLFVTTLARDCTIGLFPARDEGFGLFIEEGLSLGLKMVASDTPVFRERAQRNLRLVEPTAQSLAEGILAAHRSPWRRLEPGQVRTMRAFVADLSDLVLSAVGQA